MNLARHYGHNIKMKKDKDLARSKILVCIQMINYYYTTHNYL